MSQALTIAVEAASWALISSCSSAGSSMGRTVSKLNRRLSALDISCTPRSRMFAVASTLKPGAAKTVASSPSSSGTCSTLSDSRLIRLSWISGWTRVISSNRQSTPRCMASYMGPRTSARGEGPSASSNA